MVISRGDAPVWVVKTWGTQETRSREISGRQGSLHYGGSEISLLRSAFAQMTGEGKRSCHLSPFEMDVCCPPLSSSRAEGCAGMGGQDLGYS